jgi:hypothetical protein
MVNQQVRTLRVKGQGQLPAAAASMISSKDGAGLDCFLPVVVVVIRVYSTHLSRPSGYLWDGPPFAPVC